MSRISALTRNQQKQPQQQQPEHQRSSQYTLALSFDAATTDYNLTEPTIRSHDIITTTSDARAVRRYGYHTFNGLPATATMTMPQERAWVGHDHVHQGPPAGTSNDMLQFDSPLSEMFDDIGFGDDQDLEDLLQEDLLPVPTHLGFSSTSVSPEMGDLSFVGFGGQSYVDPTTLDMGFDLTDPVVVPQQYVDPMCSFGHGHVHAVPDLLPHNFTTGLPVNDAGYYASPSYPSEASPLATTSPGSSNESDATGLPLPYRCPADGCPKSFRKESQLKQHRRVHRKKLVCALCPHEHKFAQVRDLERHMHARHKEAATHGHVRSEDRLCPFDGCDYHGRRDNVSRHYELKHGGKLQWRRGVPSVVV